jgi:isoleucyl-tRNA synthetase
METFVDDKLSNWYVRRNRRRFWKSERGADKLSAYQTLHEVLTTLVRLLAPITPFLAEAMYRNLQAAYESGEETASVHLTDYPEADVGRIDHELSADMEALLRLVSLGSAARNAVKIKVRQVLAELKIQPADDREARAVRRFGEQICEELNLKLVALHVAPDQPLLEADVKPNMKTLGAKFGGKVTAIVSALSKAKPMDIAAKATRGESFALTLADLTEVEIEPADVVLTMRGGDGWAGVADRGTQVALDTRITEELALEGLAREVVRHVQEVRKQSGLEMEDRITLHLASESAKLKKAIDVHRSYVAAETLTASYAAQPFAEESRGAEVRIDGEALSISLRKVEGL